MCIGVIVDTVMSDDAYQKRRKVLANNLGDVVVDLDSQGERLLLSPHRYSDEHETVVEAALWVRSDRPDESSKYKTFVRRELDSGGSGRGSVNNDGGYADTRQEAIEWIEEKAQEYGGEPLNWSDRDVVVVDLETTND